MRAIDLTGKTLGDWTVIERAESLRRGGFSVARWRCRCVCGNERIVEGTNLRSGRSRGCGHARPGAPKRETVTYQGLHERLRRERGKADAHACVDCGQPAENWSLDAYEPDDLIGQHGHSLVRYSLDLSRYVARCVRNGCHVRHDAALRAALTTTTGASA